MLSTIFFRIVIPDCETIQAQHSSAILLTTLNNVGSKTLFNAVSSTLNRLFVFCCVGRVNVSLLLSWDQNLLDVCILIFFHFNNGILVVLNSDTTLYNHKLLYRFIKSFL